MTEPLSGEVPKSGPTVLDQRVAFVDDRDETLAPQRLAPVLRTLRHVARQDEIIGVGQECRV
jgi:hypothetical protein